MKYSIEPYASCSGCQRSGFTDAQNQDHFVIHETRETTSDPDLNAWYDRRGAEADDKCKPGCFFRRASLVLTISCSIGNRFVFT